MNKYTAYVHLLLKALPSVAKEQCFNLKGGTAINLFVRNMPRLSIDIDLAYVGKESRLEAFQNSKDALSRIKLHIEKSIPNVKVLHSEANDPNQIGKLFVSQNNGIQIKIEVNPVIRGSVYEGEVRDLVQNAEEEFGVAVAVPTVSLADLYGGKIVASLDRQHPRDLFDVKLLLENEGITPEIMQTFVIYLSSHNRPFHEVLKPTKKNMENLFDKEFLGMTSLDFSYKDFESTRELLIKELSNKLKPNQKEFLISLQEGSPKWALMDLEGIDKLPAILWKLENIQKMEEGKRKDSLENLKRVLQ
ncbi:nucleotidyl transferase AbiEii/AbiGii toxin family protein [Leptospira meyeri]|uniref:nucleotidyl transferase AbiEii/AbiGii toxin family protein n=1 Tax=Leptospira meyeri TaxID=29508 RepID=UPI001082EBEB|nr:nucleotidyl transferase AbiEii/AbiGii toxin family protein [Leptospira meyeri]TGM66160.1 nucleotidyl transferase AbiEii/AbiGii toxin family protein [Leptospira meyeri]